MSWTRGKVLIWSSLSWYCRPRSKDKEMTYSVAWISETRSTENRKITAIQRQIKPSLFRFTRSSGKESDRINSL